MVALAHQDLVLVAYLIYDVSVPVIPEGIAVCRVHACISVYIELSDRMSHHKLGAGIGCLIFIDSVIQFGKPVAVISHISVHRPHEVLDLQERSIHIEFDSPVDHRADI